MKEDADLNSIAANMNVFHKKVMPFIFNERLGKIEKGILLVLSAYYKLFKNDKDFAAVGIPIHILRYELSCSGFPTRNASARAALSRARKSLEDKGLIDVFHIGHRKTTHINLTEKGEVTLLFRDGAADEGKVIRRIQDRCLNASTVQHVNV